MTKWGLAATAALCAALALLAACGGGGDDNNGDNTPSTTSASGTGTATSGTPGASGTSSGDDTPGAGGTGAPVNTPVPGSTAAAVATTQAETAGTPGSGPPGSGPVIENAPTPSDAERQLQDGGVDPEQLGGDVNDPPRIVTDLPDPPAGASTDPDTIADPNASATGIEFIIDTNASEPGIQTSRTVNVGDTIRVGIVLTNVPAEGLATFNFGLNYDSRRILAPTVNGGSSLARNPDANEGGIGTSSGWSCTPPAPEGDGDEPGLWTGDGDPANGQAYISCYSTAPATQSGTIVIATVLFQAVGAGTSDLSLFDTVASAGVFVNIGGCENNDPLVPCRTATITVN